MKILNSEGNGLKGIRNLGLKSEKEILTQLERFRAECAKNMTDSCGKNMTGAYAKDTIDAFETDTGGENGEGSGRTFARRAEVRGKKDVWEADIETFHLSNYALTKLRDCRIRKVKDLYATNPKHEPGWYAVRELLEKI